MEHRPAYWTYDEIAYTQQKLHLYYFAPANRSPPPYTKRLEVTAIIDIATDGTLAGIELVMGDLPPPPRNPNPTGGNHET